MKCRDVQEERAMDMHGRGVLQQIDFATRRHDAMKALHIKKYNVKRTPCSLVHDTC